MSVTIYHNPRCSKSRQTLALLRDRGIEPVIVEYLKQPPTPGEVKRIIDRLDVPAGQLLRRNEAAYRALDLEDETLEAERVAEIIAEHPGLLQRPMVVCGGRARIGRPPEQVESVLP